MTKLRLVTWVDSRGMERWTFRDAVRPDTFKVTSVGIIVRRTKKAIVVAGTFGDLGQPDEQYHAPITIPLCAVKRIETIGTIGRKGLKTKKAKA